MTSQSAQPDAARDAAEFVVMLRELKERSGLTLRGLEEKAAAQGEVLARSTVADMLRKDALPRPELLVAFVRACGVDEPEPWLRARERLAVGEVAPAAETSPVRPPWKRPPVVLAVVVVAALVAAAVLLRGDEPDRGAADGTTGSAPVLLPLGSGGSWATIHAAYAPDLCLTEGHDSTGRYGSEVAALRPCADPGPRVLLDPVGAEFTVIKWEHPVLKQIGCLTVLRDGPAQYLLEPRDQCSDDDLDQLFRVEQVRGDRYRFRSAGGSACVGLRGGEIREGAEAIREPCTDDPDQEFTVDFTPGGPRSGG
ncbi:helix-turn-helix transcriptional regulator [Actinosynnema sp. NPDC051121]